MLDIVLYPDPRLRKKSRRVERITLSHHTLLDDMIETMYAAKGIGLAAPQVGVNERLIVVDVTPREEGETRKPSSPEIIELINPEIVSSQGEVVGDEACLSVPGFSSEVRRKEKVVVRGLDRHGNPVELEGEGLLARVLQHEIDHLDGILFFDRLSKLKREIIKKKIDRALKAA